ncbi:MAG: hypothetical protein EOO15_15365 [Chitinophagaceae bacterium]|nr:MAG: hypothetical protein EOO15_15365 [Chitinophagaceae bacterium]
MTEHAALRAAERSIPEIAQWLLLEFGDRRRAGNGAETYSFSKKSWREVERFFGPWPLKKMDQLKRVYMVVADGGSAVTVAYRD